MQPPRVLFVNFIHTLPVGRETNMAETDASDAMLEAFSRRIVALRNLRSLEGDEAEIDQLTEEHDLSDPDRTKIKPLPFSSAKRLEIFDNL